MKIYYIVIVNINKNININSQSHIDDINPLAGTNRNTWK